MTSPVYLNAAGIICSLGSGIETVSKHLFNSEPNTDYLKQSAQYSTARNLPVGEITYPLSPVQIDSENTRNNQILTTAIDPLLSKIENLKQLYGSQRIGIVIGTSTSGISDGEKALHQSRDKDCLPPDYHYRKQEISSPSRYLARWLGINGPTFSVSSACTSGAKALASGARLLKLGVVDAVIAGGVDSLCQMTIEGFSSLSVTTDSICNPFSINRNGINIGEGAGIFLMSREPAETHLAGYGETSDAHHISAPHPEGVGAEKAIRQALKSADMTAADIDYINFHGTATQQNDRMEALAVHGVFGHEIACGSTKALTGHTLAAAGAIEAIFCWLALQRNDNKLPIHRWDGQADPELPPLQAIGTAQSKNPLRAAMSNSFAFGGNNTSIILARHT